MSDTTIDRNLDHVNANLKRKVLAVLAEVNAKLPQDWKLAVFETQRTPARQLMLYQQGHSKISNANGPHCRKPLAEATDVVFQHDGQWTWDSPYWGLVDSSAMGHNLRRISWDKPHLELKPEDR